MMMIIVKIMIQMMMMMMIKLILKKYIIIIKIYIYFFKVNNNKFKIQNKAISLTFPIHQRLTLSSVHRILFLNSPFIRFHLRSRRIRFTVHGHSGKMLYQNVLIK